MFKDKKFTDYKNKFMLHKIKIGPFVEKNFINFIIEDFKNNIKFDTNTELDNINYKYYIKEKYINKKRLNYTIIEFNTDFIIDNDINIKIKSKQNHFNLWLNFFYITLERYFDSLNEIFELDFIKKNLKEKKIILNELKNHESEKLELQNK